MKRILALVFVLLSATSCWAFSPAIDAVLATTYAAAGDVTAPTHSSSSVASNGTSWTFTCDEALASGAGGTGGLTVSTSTAGAITLSSCSASGSTIVCTGSPAVVYGETISSGVSYTQPGNGFEDAAGNDLASFSNHTSFTNNVPGSDTWHWPFGLGDGDFAVDETIPTGYHVGAQIALTAAMGNIKGVAVKITNASTVNVEFCLIYGTDPGVVVDSDTVSAGSGTDHWVASDDQSWAYAITTGTYSVKAAFDSQVTVNREDGQVGIYDTNAYGTCDNTQVADYGYAVKILTGT